MVRKLLTPVDLVSIGIQCELKPFVVKEEVIVTEEKIVIRKEEVIKEVEKLIETPVINERTTTITEKVEVPVKETVI